MARKNRRARASAQAQVNTKKEENIGNKRRNPRFVQPLNLGYDRHGASSVKRALAGWIASAGSPDDDIVENIEQLRERSRDLYMGSPIATAAVKSIRTNVVGSGLTLSACVDAQSLGITEDEADEWERKTEREWKLWSSSTECDAARSLTFGQLQALVLMSALVSGDVFVTLPVIPRPYSVYSLRVNVIEGDYVCDPIPRDPRRDILQGVEIGKYGEPVAYYIAKYHPNAYVMHGLHGAQEWKRIQAFGSETGRRNVLHIMSDVERPGQRRGTPLLAPVMEALKQLGRYTEAELMAAVVAGMFTVFIKTSTPDTMLGAGIPLGAQLGATQDDPTAYELGNGSVVGLNEGESIETANPSRPVSTFDQFVMSMCKQVGAALELPYEVLLKTFNSSYSASRAALLEAWKMYYMRRDWLVSTFCRPIYEEWLAEAVAAGRIEAPGFFEDPAIRAAWSGSDWFGPAQGSINPLVEAQAAEARVQSGFSTRERETSEATGMSFDQNVRVRAREEALRMAANLVTNQNGEIVTKPEEQQQEQEVEQ